MTFSVSEIAGFLFHEAHLLDERRFDEWLDLFREDGFYWVPTKPDQASPNEGLSLFADTRANLRVRLRRLADAAAHTEKPPPRACRLVGNVVIERHEGESVLTRSKLVLHTYRLREAGRDDVYDFSATVRHHLVPDPGGFRIKLKRVDIINSEASLSVMPTPI